MTMCLQRVPGDRYVQQGDDKGSAWRQQLFAAGGAGPERGQKSVSSRFSAPDNISMTSPLDMISRTGF